MCTIIPVMHCFNNNYVIPAAAAFYSMLKYADKKYNYIFYVLHSDITDENQQKLTNLVSTFSNARLEFINMDNRFSQLWDTIKITGHYSKEVLYKLLVPSIFPQYEKIIVTDVDVIYEDDIAPEFLKFDVKEDYYLAGITYPEKKGSILEQNVKNYEKDFNPEEIKSLVIGAGYLIMNLHKMREDNLEEKLLCSVKENAFRLRQPEQDVLNLVCFPKIKLLPFRSMVCTYLYSMYPTKEVRAEEEIYWDNQLEEVLAHPVQLHYATSDKPWSNPGALKAFKWFEAIAAAGFFQEWYEMYKGCFRTETQVEKKLFPLIKVLKKNGKTKFYFLGIRLFSIKHR